MTGFIQVVTTVEKKEDAQKLASALLESRLAGCVQIVGPIQSAYWWEGNIENAQEWLCIVKSRADLYHELEKTVRENHPYKVPEIMSLPVVSGNRGYLDWLSGELRKT